VVPVRVLHAFRGALCLSPSGRQVCVKQQPHGAMSFDVVSAVLPLIQPIGSMNGFDEHRALSAGVSVGRIPHGKGDRAAAAAELSADTQGVLVALSLEAVRAGIAQEELATTLATVLPADRANQVATSSPDGQAILRSTLESLELQQDELVDFAWSRGGIAASGREQPRLGGGPIYTVSFNLRAPDGSMRTLSLTANAEELHDVVTLLKGAVRQVERDIGLGGESRST